MLLSVVALSYLLIQPVAGALADRVSAVETIRVGLFVAGVSVILAPFVEGGVLALVAVAGGATVGTVWTNTDAVISGLARRSRLGATMGEVGSFKELGDMLGPLLVGMLAQAFGLPAGFVVCGVLGLAALAWISRPARLMADL